MFPLNDGKALPGVLLIVVSTISWRGCVVMGNGGSSVLDWRSFSDKFTAGSSTVATIANVFSSNDGRCHVEISVFSL